ncbi:MAG: hypothetical protein H6Q89_3378 [Myxococcaceae bacterium]|nr:hypothetical protein [Myxococcaceae bacterium]
MLLGLSGCEPAPKGFDARDVRGNYDLTYDNNLKVALYLGGAVREVTATGYGNVLDFGTWQGQPLKLDLTQWCDRPEVQCPSEVFWPKVAVDQPDLKASNVKLQKLMVVNDTQHTLDAGVQAAVVAGLVNHDDFDRFVVGLGAGGGSSSNCVLLGLSLAGGRFSHVGEKFEEVTVFRTPLGAACDPDAGIADAGSADAGTADAGLSDAGLADAGPACAPVMVKKLVTPNGAVTNGIAEGRIGIGWAGACAFGPVVAGAVLTLETNFTGKRTGNFDPPPFTPVEVTLPDGGLDAGTLDGG